MVEPPQQPSSDETPSPFHPASVPVRPPGASGCSKPLLIGCGGLVALLGIGFLLLLLNGPKVLQWAFETMEQDLTSRLGPDVTPEDRTRLAAAFADVHRALAKKPPAIDVKKFQAFEGKFLEVASTPRPLTHRDVQDLIRLLEDLAGTPSPAP